MKSRRSFRLFPSCIVALSILSLAGCGKLELNSAWRDREIAVDGVMTDWQNGMTYVEKANVAVGLFNDAEYMYLCLTPADRRIAAQMVGLGFTVWFDPEGGKNKTFGIHFPLGMQGRGNPLMSRERVQDPEQQRNMLEMMGNELEILGPGEGQRARMPIASAKGIEVKLGESEGRLVYELKVPLVRDTEHLYAIGTDTGQKIGIGFETSELDREQMRETMGRRGGGIGGMPPGGGRMPPGGGGRGRMGGGGGMRPGGGMPGPLELWAKVTLSSEGSWTTEF